MDNLTDYQRKRYELLTNIQKMVASGFSDKDIALALGISSRTVRRNKHCDPKRCCCSENVSTEIYNYKNRILELVSEGYHATGIAKKLKEEGCSSAISTIRKNAVVSPLSNGFVEGINNRTKMIKRVMYGRCGIDLLSAKIILPYAKNG